MKHLPCSGPYRSALCLGDSTVQSRLANRHPPFLIFPNLVFFFPPWGVDHVSSSHSLCFLHANPPSASPARDCCSTDPKGCRSRATFDIFLFRFWQFRLRLSLCPSGGLSSTSPPLDFRVPLASAVPEFRRSHSSPKGTLDPTFPPFFERLCPFHWLFPPRSTHLVPPSVVKRDLFFSKPARFERPKPHDFFPRETQPATPLRITLLAARMFFEKRTLLLFLPSR